MQLELCNIDHFEMLSLVSSKGETKQLGYTYKALWITQTTEHNRQNIPIMDILILHTGSSLQ